jgi:hypothetical protein
MNGCAGAAFGGTTGELVDCSTVKVRTFVLLKYSISSAVASSRGGSSGIEKVSFVSQNHLL